MKIWFNNIEEHQKWFLKDFSISVVFWHNDIKLIHFKDNRIMKTKKPWAHL